MNFNANRAYLSFNTIINAIICMTHRCNSRYICINWRCNLQPFYIEYIYTGIAYKCWFRRKLLDERMSWNRDLLYVNKKCIDIFFIELKAMSHCNTSKSSFYKAKPVKQRTMSKLLTIPLCFDVYIASVECIQDTFNLSTWRSNIMKLLADVGTPMNAIVGWSMLKTCLYSGWMKLSVTWMPVSTLKNGYEYLYPGQNEEIKNNTL